MCIQMSQHFDSRELDFDQMSSIYELDLTILKMYLHSKHELSRSSLLKRALQTGGQKDRQTDR